MSKFPDDYSPPPTINPGTMPFSCQWILSVLNKAISMTVLSLNAYEFSDAATSVYSWWQYQFCDIFIEAIKPYFAGDNPAFSSERNFARDALWVCLESGLRLLHPFMPFVSEELWQRLPGVKSHTRKESIMICEYPSPIEVSSSFIWLIFFGLIILKTENHDNCVNKKFVQVQLYFSFCAMAVIFFPLQSWTNERVEYEMDLVESTVRSLRSLRAELLAKQKNERFICEGFSFFKSSKKLAFDCLDISHSISLSSYF